MSDETSRDQGRTEEENILRERYHRQIAAITRATWPPTEIARRLRQEVVGQDEAITMLAGVLHRHLLTLRAECDRPAIPPPSCKTPCLLIGDSGVGKTKLVTEVAKLTSLPAVIADTSQLTEAGFVGSSVDDYCAELIEKSNMSLWLSARGLVYADELDKCRIQPTLTRDVSGGGAQDSLLKLCDASGEIYCHGVTNGPQTSKRYVGPFEVGRLMVIAGGAFGGHGGLSLYDIIARRLQGRRSIGFGTAAPQGLDDAQRRAGVLERVSADDLVAYGMKVELVSRLATICVLRPLTAEQMMRILAVVPGGPVRTTRRLCELMGFEIRLTRPLLSTIVDEAMSAGLGARALAGITERACRRALYEVPQRIRGTRTQKAIVTLGVGALRDGEYRLEWRASRRSEKTPRRLIGGDDAAGEADESGTNAG